MGVPQFFRYLSEKYPHIMVDCVEELIVKHDGSEPCPPSDISASNPNNIEFDNLYLDMNGIIHPCTHPEDAPAPTTESEMFAAVFDYIDRIMSIVRPRKVLYMAIDGVAPRAKINQQRSRRFRSAKEAEQKAKEAEALKSEWTKRGLKLSKLGESADWISDIPKQLAQETTDVGEDAPFDSNVITPGTPFMERLAIALKEFAARRVATTPGWKGLRVIFSDASMPGEGEHKIAEYIRVERAMEYYDPNIRHVLYGLDADLIMLALATHEVCFSVLREEVFPKNGGRRQGHDNADTGGRHGLPTPMHAPTQIDALMASAEAADGLAKASGSGMLTRAELGGKKPFQFLHINVLREYLDLEFRYDLEREIAAASKAPQPGAPEGIAYDLERVIDDFVFLCFFVGNDFLPHLPTLSIREGAIDFIIEVYKTDLAHVGYLTSGAGDVDFTRAKRMLSRIGTKEDEVFQERKVKEEQSLARDVEQRKRVAEAKERQKQQQAAAKQTRSLLPEKRKPLQPASVSSAPTDASKALASAPVSPPIPPIETLMELGDKNKRLRVGDGSANKAAAEKFKRKLTALKQGKATANVGASGGSKTGLSVAELGIAKRVPGGPSTKAALPVEKSGRDQSVGSSSAVKPAESSNAVSENASAGVDWPEDEAVPAAVEERTLKEFEKELKERLDAQGVIENPTDNVRLGDEGWKDRYYLHKFNWGPEDGERKERLFHVYLEGLYWVMKYYYVGCISWNWYYPYHYAPFASDIVSSRTTSENIKLEMGNPFRPFTQLQAVMPASSGVLVLPKCYSRLMTDPDSPIIDYYPDEFEIDLNGKRFAWQGVALLPFIDEKRLNEALEGLDSQLTDVEKARNSFGDCLVVAHTDSSLGRAVVALAGENPDGELEIAPALAEGQLFGKVSPRGTLGPGDAVVAARFELPPFKAHQTSLLRGAQPPPEVLDDFTKAECAQRGGWKPARFGSLGRAARELAENRDYRLGGGRGRSSRGRGRGGGRGGASNGRGGAMPAGSYYQSNAPVINPPVHPSAAAMFGGLGLGGGAMPGIAGAGQPAWMAQNAAMYQAQPQIGYQDQQHQYMYGSNAAYGAQGGYNAQYGGQAYLAPTYPGGGYQGGYAPQYGGAAAGVYAPGAAQQQYNFSANPAFYTQQQHAGGVPSTAPTGGGLAGPTAMQMRQASHPQPVRSRPQWSQFSQPAANQGRGGARGGRGGRGRSS